MYTHTVQGRAGGVTFAASMHQRRSGCGPRSTSPTGHLPPLPTPHSAEEGASRAVQLVAEPLDVVERV